MDDQRERALDRLIAKDAIQTALNRYAQGIDRCDEAILKSIYWPDATDDHGTFRGNAYDFAEYIVPFLLKMDHTMHCITNVDIELETPDAAHVQSYFIAYHETDQMEVIVGGRYLDHFTRRQGEWRIQKRVVVMDWNQQRPSTAVWGEGEMFSTLKQGGRSPQDIFYVWRKDSVTEVR